MTTYLEVKQMVEDHSASVVYASKRAKVAHFSDSPSSDGPDGVTFCGLPGPWLGTGSQDERDRAWALPICMACAGRVLMKGWATCGGHAR